MEVETIKSDVSMSWVRVKLSSIAEVIAGQSPESKYYNNNGNGIPFFQGKADFGIDYPTVRNWCTQPTKIAKPLDILFSVRAPVGPTNICDVEACIGRGLAAIRAGDSLYYKFLYFFFKTIEEKLASQGNGSTFSAITTSVLKDLEIPLPPLPTQKRIAEILDAADALRRKDQELLKKYDELAQAIFIDMFGDPVKNEKGWEVKKLDAVCSKITDGEHINPETLPEGKPLIMAKDIRFEGVDFSDYKCVSENDFIKFTKKCNPKKGDLILVSRGATIGRCCVVDTEREFCLMGSTILIKPNNNLNTSYLNQLFKIQNFKSRLVNVSSASAQQAIYISNVKELKIPIPTLEHQKRFHETIREIKKQFANFSVEMIHSDLLFQSLIQKAFKGELV